MAKRKIALFGGTFDPVHLGHTTVAADAAKHIGAEKIIFIPAKRSPLACRSQYLYQKKAEEKSLRKERRATLFMQAKKTSAHF